MSLVAGNDAMAANWAKLRLSVMSNEYEASRRVSRWALFLIEFLFFGCRTSCADSAQPQQETKNICAQEQQDLEDSQLGDSKKLKVFDSKAAGKGMFSACQ